MLKYRKAFSFILAIIMALTITSQVPAFALEEAQEQPAAEQHEELNEEPSVEENTEIVEEQTEEQAEESQTEADAAEQHEEALMEAEPEASQAEAMAVEQEEELTAMGSVITASGLTEVKSPTAAKWDGKTIDISWYDPDESSFTIDTGAKLAGLAALVNGSYDKTIKQYAGTTQLAYIKCVKLDNFAFTGAGGGNTGGTCYKSLGTHDFMGKTVTITEDLDMTAGNYMPIGGKYPMCDANGSMYVNNEGGKGDAHVIEAYFNGILDGGGHTIKIKCDRSTKSGYAYSMAIGFIGYMGDVIDKDEAEKHGAPFEAQELKDNWTNWTPSVRNLSLEGTMHGRRQIGGVVGQTGDAWDEEHGVFVENCANHTTVSGTDSKGVGGVVGNAGGKGHIINCYNTGDISSVYSTAPVGGICANNSGMDIYNCYNTGEMSGNDRGRGLGGHDSGSYTIDNCFTLKGCNSDSQNALWYKGTAADITLKNLESLTAEEMTNEGFAQRLNAGDGDNNYDKGAYTWTEDKNNGYPILYFENGESGPKCTVTRDTVNNGEVSCLYNGQILSGGSEVPYGAVLTLLETHDGGYILNKYLAGSGNADMDLIADFCTVTEDVHVGADIVQLKEGTLHIDSDNSEDCTVAVTKKGFYYDGEKINEVKKQKVVDGNRLYQLDVLTVSAVLYDNANPSDAEKEYSGEFKYTFQYMKDGEQVGKTETNQTGKITIDKNIDGAQLVVTAEPMAQPKTWQSFADTSWYYDNEPGEDYVIDSSEDLAGLAYLVNVEQITFEDETIVIPEGTVISLKNTDGRGGVMRWPGIGVNSSVYFGGTLEGNGCTILDMSRIDQEGSEAGLFNYCCNASISGLNVRGVTKVHTIGGGVIGYGENCRISRCINYVDVTNQRSKGEEDEEGAAGDRAGGIIAQAKGGFITDCINRGDISGNSGIGGIAGQCHGSEVTISKCTNYGEVTTAEYSGTYNLRPTGTNGIGGIAGRVYGDISLCANYGDIRSTDASTGGIAGYIPEKGIAKAFAVTGCYNRGKIDARSNNTLMYAGGLIGKCGSVILANSYNAGAVTGGSASGYICGAVGYFELKSGTSASNNYVLTGQEAWGMPADKEPDIDIQAKDDAYLKSDAFAADLNDPEFIAVSNSYPEFRRLTDESSIEKTCTVTFSGSDLDGKSFKINRGGSIPYIPAGEWSSYSFSVGGEEWTGRNITSDVTVSVTKNTNVSFHAVFMADGQIIAEVPYNRNTEYASIKPDAAGIVERDGYAAKWPDDITLNSEGNTIINAVYYPSGSMIEVQGDVSVPDVSVTDGKYYIGGRSTGAITVTEDSTVTLIGDSGMCENLRVLLEDGAKLTAKNLQLSCDTESVLTMNEGCTLTLAGSKGFIEGTDTGSKECVPAINVLGSSTINGDGTLKATSETGDTVIDIADGKKLTISSGTVKLYKNSKIGLFEGGVVNSGRGPDSGTGILSITGGTVYCTSNSDNMHAVKVGSFNMSGGDVLIASNDAEKALSADNMTVAEGNLKVFSADYEKNETDKSAKNRAYYYNEEAIGCSAFTDDYTCTKVNVNNMSKPYQAVVGDTTFTCNGLSLDYDIDGEKLVRTSDASVYIWSRNDVAATVAPAGADMSSLENQRGYSVEENGIAVNVTMTGTRGYNKHWYKACATYDADGNMLEFKYKQIKDSTALEMNTLSGGAASYEVFILQDINTLIPGLSSCKIGE